MYKFNPLTWKFDLVTDISTKADLVDWKVPTEQLPSYVDDVIEVANLAALPLTWEQGKIYVTLDDNKNYRWSGSTYILLNPVDLSNYYNKTETNIRISWTKLNSNSVTLNSNTSIDDFTYPSNTVFLCWSGITVTINPELSFTAWMEYTFINIDDSIITLDATAGHSIWNSQTFKLTNLLQSVTLYRHSELVWNLSNEFTNETKKIAAQYNFIPNDLPAWYSYTPKLDTSSWFIDSWILKSNVKTTDCFTYSWNWTYIIKKEGWYEISWYFFIRWYFWAIAASWGTLSSEIAIYNNIGWTPGYILWYLGCYSGSAESSTNTKLLPFSWKVYLKKNSSFEFKIYTWSAFNEGYLWPSKVTIEYLGN